MPKTLNALMLAGLAMMAAPVSAQTPPPPASIPAATPLGSGPSLALMEADPGLATHTVYRPADLAAVGAAKLPIVA